MNQRYSIGLNSTLIVLAASGLLTLLPGCPAPANECITDAECDDGLFCNGVEICENGACHSDGNPCSANQTCDEQSDACKPDSCNSDAACDDGLFCNGAETCANGFCHPGTSPCTAVQWEVNAAGNGHFYDVILVGTPVSWDDARNAAQTIGPGWDLVTVTSVAESAFVENLFSSAPSFFNPAPSGTNRSGPWIGGFNVVSANNFAWVTTEPVAFTDWGPSEPFGNGAAISYTDFTFPFGDGSGIAWNDIGPELRADGPIAFITEAAPELPAAAVTCDEQGDACILSAQCATDDYCDDTLFCNGRETCVDGSCQAGAAPCGIGETCDEDTGSCPPTECTTDAGCDDVNACTTDNCVAGTCANVTVVCDPGLACNSSTGLCEATCVANADCDDTLFCNGAETCVGGFCQVSAGPCSVGEACDEDARECTTSGSLPFFDDFEAGIGDWFADNGIWEVGVPMSGPNSAHSPQYVAATVLAGDYPDGTSSRLVSPSIQLPAVIAGNALHLRFWHWFTFGGGGSCLGCYGDFGMVQIREQTGPGQWGEWTTLSTFAGSSGVYTNALVDLSGYSGKKVQVGFLLSNGPWAAAAGWYVDDVTIDVF